jgi:hypothetical protein
VSSNLRRRRPVISAAPADKRGAKRHCGRSDRLGAAIAPDKATMPTAINPLSLNPSVVARFLGVTAFVLIIASVVTQCAKFGLGYDYLKGLVPLFHLNEEYNVPTFFSALLFLFAALILAAIAVLGSNTRAPYVVQWQVLCIGFVYFAYDELFEIHEYFEILEKLHQFGALLNGSDPANLDFGWVIPYTVVLISLLVFFWKFVSSLPANTRTGFMISAGIFFGAAIGIDQIGERYAELHGSNFTHEIISTIEESLELTGVIVFIWTLLKYFENEYVQLCIRTGK